MFAICKEKNHKKREILRQTQSAGVFAAIVDRNFVPSNALSANCLLLVQEQKNDGTVIEIVEMVAGEAISFESLSHAEFAFFLRFLIFFWFIRFCVVFLETNNLCFSRLREKLQQLFN